MKKFKFKLTISLDEYLLLKSLIPDWAKIVPKGLDPTFYGTGSYEGDIKVMNKVKDIHKRLFPGDFELEDFEPYYPENVGC